VEAQILEAIAWTNVDESEVLSQRMKTITSHNTHLDAVCLRLPEPGRGLRRMEKGAAMIRTKGEAGTGDVWRRTPCATGAGDIRTLQNKRMRADGFARIWGTL